MTIPDCVVFDTEPLVAHADDEPGSETVETYLDAVAVGDATGYTNCVNLTEVRYILTRKYDRSVTDEYLDWLFEIGITAVGVHALWIEAAEYVIEYNPALGDSFALATSQHVGGTLIVGADNDYDEIAGDLIERFREEPA